MPDLAYIMPDLAYIMLNLAYIMLVPKQAKRSSSSDILLYKHEGKVCGCDSCEITIDRKYIYNTRRMSFDI